MIEDELTTAGERIKRARLLAGINTRKKFKEKYSISVNTLQGWEQGKNKLTAKGARRLVAALKQEGLLCSIDWLINGQGMPPRPYEMVNVGINEPVLQNELFAERNLQEEQIIYEEVQLFKRHYSNAVVLVVHDDALEPYFSAGDQIGGIQLPNEEIRRYTNSMCILELENNLILARMLQSGKSPDRFTACCTNPSTQATPLNLYNVKVISAAPVVWHRRKIISLRAND